MRSRIIALGGKGGVGKTALSAAIIRELAQEKTQKILAIDADPAMGLCGALGLTPATTVDEIRNRFIDALHQGQDQNRENLAAQLDYEVFEALSEKDNVALLALGRPEADGCYCQVNTFLKEIIASLASHFDYVVIDCEAGIEQVNRRVLTHITDLILVSDLSARGLRVAETISHVAKNLLGDHQCGLIINRVEAQDNAPRGIRIPLLACVPEDPVLRACDINGQSIFGLPETEALQAVRETINSLRQRGGRSHSNEKHLESDCP